MAAVVYLPQMCTTQEGAATWPQGIRYPGTPPMARQVAGVMWLVALPEAVRDRTAFRTPPTWLGRVVVGAAETAQALAEMAATVVAMARAAAVVAQASTGLTRALAATAQTGIASWSAGEVTA